MVPLLASSIGLLVLLMYFPGGLVQIAFSARAALLAWYDKRLPDTVVARMAVEDVVPVAAIPQLAELNIGHFLIGEAIFTGLDESVRQMRSLMDAAR